MRILPMKIKMLKFPKRIGNLIPLNHLTLLSGLPGTGKSYSLLKFLNENGISPVLFNLDYDSSLLPFTLNASRDDSQELEYLVNNEFSNIQGSVIVLDTYQECKRILGLEAVKKQETFVHQLQVLCREQNCTIIVVGHPTDLVGSTGIFKDNPALVRNCYEHLHLDKVIDKRKKPSTTTFTLYVNKGRGIGGSKIIHDWMRD